MLQVAQKPIHTDETISETDSFNKAGETIKTDEVKVSETFNLEYSCASVRECIETYPSYQIVQLLVLDIPEQEQYIYSVYQEVNINNQVTGASAPVEAAWVIVLVLLVQLTIFSATLFALWKMWKSILNFIMTSNDKQQTILQAIFGQVSIEGNKGKIIGSGILGTFVLLAIAVVAMYLVGDVTIS